jgi:hypothetical protein
MDAKSCLLCGKSLARIRVGSGGDFCSREHRNQYRLRRSIDCLTEANKVATLARRRETPKAVFAEPLPALANAVSRPMPNAQGGSQMGQTASSIALPKADGALRRRMLGAGGENGAAAQWPPRSTQRHPALSLDDEAIPGALDSAPCREFGFLTPPAHSLCTPEAKPTAWKAQFSKRDPQSPAAMAPQPFAGNALRVSASAALRPGKPEVPRVRAAVALEKSALRRASRVRVLTPPPEAEAPAARLTYVDLAFTAAPDAPARLEWIGKQPGFDPAGA